MANFEVPEKPEFNNQIRKLEESDPAHANLFNAIIEALLNNELFLKKVQDALVESLKEHLENETNPHKVTKEQVGVPENAVFTDTTYEVFQAPNTSGIGAQAGLVPAPTVADIPKVLGGGGAWVPANDHSHGDYALKIHSHTASDVGALPQNGTAAKTNAFHVPRVSKNPSYQPGMYTAALEEFQSGSEGLPSAQYYHILTSQGGDANYEVQLAIGMTVDDMYFRNKKSGTWGNWIKMMHSGNAIPKTGGTFTGAIGTGGKVTLWTDNEGGNIRITAPDSYNKYWEMDAFNGDLRLYQHDNGTNSNYMPFSLTKDTLVANKIKASGEITGSLTGNASTATALTTSAGSATQPVYFSSGKPVACELDYLPASYYGSTSSAVKMYNLLGDTGGVQLLSNSGSAIYIGSGSNETILIGNHVSLISNGHVYCNGSDGSSFMCQTSNYMNLGHSSYKWKAVYATTGTIQTSDRNAKNSIEDLNEDFVSKFMLGLKPVRYKLNESDSNRYHWGLISQDIEELMEELGMDSKDFAGFIKSPKTKLNDDGEEEIVEGEYTYSLRYDEFIAPIIKLMQIQQSRIEELEKDIESLKEELLKLRA